MNTHMQTMIKTYNDNVKKINLDKKAYIMQIQKQNQKIDTSPIASL